MPATSQDYSKIKEYQEAAIASKKEGSGLESAAFTLGDKVMEAVRADRATRGVSKLATDVGNVMGQMVTDPNQIRAATSGMVDPFSVNALTSGARAQNLRTLGTVATQEAQNQGTIDEVIQAGANQLKARAQALYAKAEEEMARAASVQGEWDRMMEEKKFAASQAGKGGGGGAGGGGGGGKGTAAATAVDIKTDIANLAADGITEKEAVIQKLMELYPELSGTEIRVMAGPGYEPPQQQIMQGKNIWEPFKNMGQGGLATAYSSGMDRILAPLYNLFGKGKIK